MEDGEEKEGRVANDEKPIGLRGIARTDQLPKGRDQITKTKTNHAS